MNVLLAPLRPGLPRWAKLGLVTGGYAIAFMMATIVTAIHVARTQGPDVQASSGMHAFGDSLVWIGVFSLAASVPTALALAYLRNVTRFWWVSAGFALALAATGVAASALYVVWAGQPLSTGLLDTLAMLSPLRLLLAPVFAGAFALFALLAPARGPRRLFTLAAVVEGLAGAAAFLQLLSRAG